MRLVAATLSTLFLSSTIAIAQTGFTQQIYPATPGDDTVLSADFNHDGHADLLTYGSRQSNFHLYLNDGSGKFGAPITVPNNNLGTITFAKIADVNGDGSPDIVAVQGTSLVVYLNDGTGNFTATAQQPAPSGVAGMVIGDVNLDGHQDVILDSSTQVPSTDPNTPGYTFQNSLETYFGDGTGKFGTPVTQSNINLDLNVPSQYQDLDCGITGITGGNFFLDNQLSLFVASNCVYFNPAPATAGTLSLAHGDGTGHFTFNTPVQAQYGGAKLLTTVDAGQNVTPDVAYAAGGAYGSYEGLIQGVNNGGGNFSYVDLAPYGGDGYQGIATADFNGDGLPDLVTTQYNDSPYGLYPGPAVVSLYSGTASGAFTASQTFNVGGQNTGIHGVGAADFNGDGLADFATLVVDETSGNYSNYPTQLYVYSSTTTCTAPLTANSNIICTPVNGKAATSPVNVTAASNVAGLTLNRLYLDNVNVYQTTSATVSTSLTVTSGSHKLVLVSYNNKGQAFTSTSTFTVAATSTGCSESTAGVTICSPAVNTTTSSPLTISAAALAQAGNITAVRGYIDGAAVFTVNNPTASNQQQVSQTVSASTGSHNLVVIGYQSNGGYVKASETFTVSGATPCYPPSVGASICTPTSGSTLASPFTLTAGARVGSGYVTAIRVYIDNVEQTQISYSEKSSTFAIDASFKAAAGKHTIVVVGYQSTGGSVSASSTVTIQ